MALSQLLYVSEEVGHVTLDDLLAIQEASIRNNARHNISGILFHYQGHFVQFLEGEQRRVRELFEWIEQDDRHTNVKLIYERLASRRRFAQWHMAMLDLDLHGESERADLEEMVRGASAGAIGFDDMPKDLFILEGFAKLLSA